MKLHAFVAMPFGVKRDSQGNEIDFNRVYTELIRPALEDAGLEAFRADEEQRARGADENDRREVAVEAAQGRDQRRRSATITLRPSVELWAAGLPADDGASEIHSRGGLGIFSVMAAGAWGTGGGDAPARGRADRGDHPREGSQPRRGGQLHATHA